MIHKRGAPSSMMDHRGSTTSSTAPRLLTAATRAVGSTSEPNHHLQYQLPRCTTNQCRPLTMTMAILRTWGWARSIRAALRNRSEVAEAAEPADRPMATSGPTKAAEVGTRIATTTRRTPIPQEALEATPKATAPALRPASSTATDRLLKSTLRIGSPPPAIKPIEVLLNMDLIALLIVKD